MSFSSFSKDVTANMYTSVENKFITNFLPTADGDAVRAYLFGLYLCNCKEEFDAENVAKLLNIPYERFLEIFGFWEDCDLVRILSRKPLFVEYLPVSAAVGRPKALRPEKYMEFNREFYKILNKAGKDFKPYEMQRVLEFLENNPMEQQAFLLVTEYCAKKDGAKLTCAHVLNKAAKLCKEQKFTYEQVEQELSDSSNREKELFALTYKLAAQMNLNVQNPRVYCEKYVEKWTAYGYSESSLLSLAAFGLELGYKFPELDALVERLQKDGFKTDSDIQSYCEKQREPLALLQRLQPVLGVLRKTEATLKKIADWKAMGFTDEIVLEAAKLSANASSPLPYMNKLLAEWKKQNVRSVESIPKNAPSARRTEATVAADERSERERYYAARRNRVIAIADAAVSRARKDPAYEAAEAELKRGEIALAKAEVFSPATLPKVKEQLEAARKNRAAALARLHLTEADFTPRFGCTLCSDTGFLPNGKMCDCYNKQD